MVQGPSPMLEQGPAVLESRCAYLDMIRGGPPRFVRGRFLHAFPDQGRYWVGPPLFKTIQTAILKKPGTDPPSSRNATHQNRENSSVGCTTIAPAPSSPPISGIQVGAFGRVKRRTRASQLIAESHSAPHASSATASHRRTITVSMVFQGAEGTVGGNRSMFIKGCCLAL